MKRVIDRFEEYTDVEYGVGYFDGERYEHHGLRLSDTGKWVHHSDVEKLEKRIARMQKRINMLEGRTV